MDTSAAAAYEAFLVPGLVEPWAELVVSAARVTERMTVLDVGCGTGIAARRAARAITSNGRVMGIDIDSGMLSIARSSSMKEGLTVEYGLSSACDLPLIDGSFDAVLCLQGLQYFPDPLQALRELHRVLRPGSSLAVVTWSEIQSCKGYWAMVTALERRDIDAAPARKPFAFADASKLQMLAATAGFKDIVISTEQRIGRFRSASAFLNAMLQAAPSSRLALEKVPANEWHAFQSEVEAMLAPWQSAAELAFPMESHVLVARR